MCSTGVKLLKVNVNKIFYINSPSIKDAIKPLVPKAMWHPSPKCVWFSGSLSGSSKKIFRAGRLELPRQTWVSLRYGLTSISYIWSDPLGPFPCQVRLVHTERLCRKAVWAVVTRRGREMGRAWRYGTGWCGTDMGGLKRDWTQFVRCACRWNQVVFCSKASPQMSCPKHVLAGPC